MTGPSTWGNRGALEEFDPQPSDVGVDTVQDRRPPVVYWMDVPQLSALSPVIRRLGSSVGNSRRDHPGDSTALAARVVPVRIDSGWTNAFDRSCLGGAAHR